MAPHIPRSLARVDTVFSADSIEFSPLHPDVFFCGTYQVDQVPEEKSHQTTSEDGDENAKARSESDGNDYEDEGEDGDQPESSSAPAIRRKGRALLYRLNSDRSGMTEIQRIDGPAILDAKWTQVGYGNRPQGDNQDEQEDGKGDRHTLAIGNAEGQIVLHHWDEDKGQLQQGQVIQVTDPTTLCLSVDWSPSPTFPGCTSPISPTLITSLSSGHLAYLIPSSTGGLTIDQEWQAHEYEPWITSFDLWTPHMVWSGGDDCLLKRWDLRDTSFARSTTKGFDGGVTTVSSSPHTEHLLVVGSYDEYLRLFDTRNMRTPLRKIPVGGGIWRTRWNTTSRRKGELLLACMHGGFKVLKLTDQFLAAGAEPSGWTTNDSDQDMDKGDGWERTVLFEEHESIAYGVDWSRLELDGQDEGRSMIASCSFYDHSLMLWKA